MDQLSNIFSAVLTETFGLESMTLAVMQIPIFRCCVPSTFSDVCFILGLLLFIQSFILVLSMSGHLVHDTVALILL